MQVHVAIHNGRELPHCQSGDGSEDNQKRLGIQHDASNEDGNEQRSSYGTYNQILHASFGLSVSVDGSEDGVAAPCPFSLAFSASSMTA